MKRESESDLVRRKSSTRLRFKMRSYTNCLLRYTANMGIHGRAFLLYFLEQKYNKASSYVVVGPENFVHHEVGTGPVLQGLLFTKH